MRIDQLMSEEALERLVARLRQRVTPNSPEYVKAVVVQAEIIEGLREVNKQLAEKLEHNAQTLSDVILSHVTHSEQYAAEIKRLQVLLNRIASLAKGVVALGPPNDWGELVKHMGYIAEGDYEEI